LKNRNKTNPIKPGFSPKKEVGKGRVNFTFIIEGVGDDPVLLGEIIDDILTHWPVFLNRLGKAIEKKDQKGIEYWSHTLKGNLSFLQAEEAKTIAEHLEFSGRDGNLENLSSHFERLKEEVKHITDELIAFQDKKFAA